MFSSAGCGKCTATKYGLRKRGYDPHEVRVDQVPEAEAALKRSGYTHLPVVMAYRSEEDEVPDIWEDFHPDNLDALVTDSAIATP